MRELVYDKTKLPTFKAFYEKIYSEFDVVNRSDMEDYPNLGYNADLLNEFLWGFQNDDLVFVMKNFDLDKMKNIKSYDNYEWNILLEVITEFVKKGMKL